MMESPTPDSRENVLIVDGMTTIYDADDEPIGVSVYAEFPILGVTEDSYEILYYNDRIAYVRFAESNAEPLIPIDIDD